MATVASLSSRLTALKVRIEKATTRASRSWTMTLEEGQELSENLRAQLGPDDLVIIHYMPRNYLGECDHSQVMACWRPGPRGRNTPYLIRDYSGVDTRSV